MPQLWVVEGSAGRGGEAMICVCGHPEEAHRGGRECNGEEVEACKCAMFEEDE